MTYARYFVSICVAASCMMCVDSYSMNKSMKKKLPSRNEIIGSIEATVALWPAYYESPSRIPLYVAISVEYFSCGIIAIGLDKQSTIADRIKELSRLLAALPSIKSISWNGGNTTSNGATLDPSDFKSDTQYPGYHPALPLMITIET